MRIGSRLRRRRDRHAAPPPPRLVVMAHRRRLRESKRRSCQHGMVCALRSSDHPMSLQTHCLLAVAAALRLAEFGWSTSGQLDVRRPPLAARVAIPGKEDCDGIERPRPRSGRARHLPPAERQVRGLLAPCRQAALPHGRLRRRRGAACAAGADRGDERADLTAASLRDRRRLVGRAPSRRSSPPASATRARSRRTATSSTATCYRH